MHLDVSAVRETNFKLPGQTAFYRGKVRDVYTINDRYLVMVASDRISAFDHILPEPIPGKGAILNTIAARFLEMTQDIVPNWLINTPDARASVGVKCKAFPVEMVIRGYLCGHALREYSKGIRVLSGTPMPGGMRPYQKFPEPIITPATKAEEGHDEDISGKEIVEQGLVSKEDYQQLEKYTRELFRFGQEYAAKHGLILADTKYEFGKINGKIYLIDEIHTPDSSRYFYADGFLKHIEAGDTPKQLSKEFVREWLMANGFQGREGDKMPDMTPEVVSKIQERYLELYRVIMGEEFSTNDLAKSEEELEAKIDRAVGYLNY